VAGGGVLTSLSRGGELAGLAALVTMAALALPKSRVLVGIAGIAVAAVIVGVIVGLVPSSVTDPLAQQLGVANIDVANPSPANWPVAERLAHMQAGLAMWADHPFLGVGIGNYAAVYDKYQVAPVWQFALGHAHNYYINIGAEAGVVGLLAFLLLIVSALVICVRAFRRSQQPLDRAVGLGAAGVVVGIAVHSFFDNIFVHGMEVQVALVMVAASRVYAGFDEDSALEQSG
jgi:O-antigen ligase